ncbi:MAG: hypothetical protein ACKVVP_01465 [Chloroflexota bacterium]
MTTLVRTPGHRTAPFRAFLTWLPQMFLATMLLASCAVPTTSGPASGAPPSLIQTPPAPRITVTPGFHHMGGPVAFPFEANLGQARAGVDFLLRIGDLQVAPHLYRPPLLPLRHCPR